MFIMRMATGGNITGMERGDKKIKECVTNLKRFEQKISKRNQIR